MQDTASIRLTPAGESISASLLADLVAVFTQWQNNWSSHDFTAAFKTSRMMQSDEAYFWNKFESSDRNTAAFYWQLDHTHQQMLVQYLFEKKYAGDINRYRQVRRIYAEEE